MVLLENHQTEAVIGFLKSLLAGKGEDAQEVHPAGQDGPQIG